MAAQANDRTGAWSMIEQATQARRELAGEADADGLVCAAHQLSRGPQPRVICLSALVPPTGPAQWMQFARVFQGSREVHVLTNPGWSPGEALPRDLNALIRCQVRTVLEIAAGEPFVLCGYSSGGWLAHRLAERLEADGVSIDGMVLIDSHALAPEDFAIDPLTRLSRVRANFPLPGSGVLPDPACDEELTAMCTYLDLFKDWRPASLSTRTLILSCSEVIRLGPAQVFDGAKRYDDSQALIKVPGNHFSMMQEFARESAQAALDWLGDDAASSLRAAE
jgi:thioesterase domain-containing protein